MRFGLGRWMGLFWCLLGCVGPVAAWQDRTDPLARFKSQSDSYLELWRKGEYAQSLAFLEKAIMASQDGVPMTWLYDRAKLLFVVGDIDSAISEVEWLHLRRPSPATAMQLAHYYKERGSIEAYDRTLAESAERYAKYGGEKDDAENAIAILEMRELLGENPRVLFAEFAKIEDPDKEDQRNIHRAAGEMALRKYDYELAAKEFEKGLELDPNDLDLVAALGECYWRSQDERLEPTLAKVEAVNSRHLRVLAIRAEQALDAGNIPEALKLIQRALVVNSRNLTFLGLKAAAYFLDNNELERRAAEELALLYNPHSSAVFRIQGRIASRQYRFAEGAAFQKAALARDAGDNEARSLYGFDLLRMGMDVEGRAQLEQSFKADPYQVPVYNMLELLDTLATFETVEAKPFRLKMPKREREVWGDEALALVHEAHSKLSADYQVRLSDPIHLQIFDNHDDFMVRSVGLPGAIGYLGICFGNLITMDAPSARERGTFNWKSTLWHEFAHVVTLQKTKNRMPRWLSEGISVYEETRRDPAWGQRPDPGYAQVVAEGAPSLSTLETYFSKPQTAAHLVFGYYVAGEFVAFYVKNYGQKALVQALDAIGSGSATIPALVAAAGISEEALNTSFKDLMTEVLKPYRNLPSAKPNFLERMSGANQPTKGLVDAPFPAALEKGRKALAEKRYEEAERWYREADSLFPEMVGEGSPLVALADVYAAWGKAEKQVEVFERIVQLTHTDWGVLTFLADHYHEKGDWDKLIEVTDAALGVDPFDAELHRRLRDAYRAKGKDDKALAGLAKLVRVDQSREVEYLLERVELHVAAKRWDIAKKEVLEVLERVPHSWAAQSLLLQVQARGAK